MRKLLIVECVPFVLAELKEKLNAPNLSIATAGSTEEALEKLTKQSFDLVLASTDYPSPNGWDILAASQKAENPIPVMLMSSKFLDDEKAKAEAIAKGAFGAIEKPIFLNTLYEAIEIALDFKIEGRERRKYPRLPIRLDVVVTIGKREASRFMRKTHTVDLSLGGLCFESEQCTTCGGYIKWDIDPKCIYHKYNWKNPIHATFKVELVLAMPEELESGKDVDVMEIDCAVAYVIKEKETGKEYIGLKFENFEDAERMRLKKFLRRIADAVK